MQQETTKYEVWVRYYGQGVSHHGTYDSLEFATHVATCQSNSHQIATVKEAKKPIQDPQGGPH